MRMIRTFMLCLTLVPAVLTAQTARQCFAAMPDSLSMLLTANDRADFIDFMDSNMKAEVSNRLGGKSEMTVLTDDYISINTSPQSTWQMKLLPLGGNRRLICTVSTVCGSACDSRIRFYDTGWRELRTRDYLPDMPETADFIRAIPDTARYAVKDARRQADMLLMKASLSADGNDLTFSFTTPEYMDPQAAAELKPYLKADAVYRWTGKRFSKERSRD